jgi:hypothetical protein
MSKTCYIPLKGVDDVIANELGWSCSNDKGERVPDVFRVASLRAMYDESHKTPLNVDNLGETMSTLKVFASDIAKVNVSKINIASSHLSTSYAKLRSSFGYQERNDRVVMIASYFSAVLDDLQKRYPNVPRRALIEGFKNKDGIQIGGQAAIFEEVYNRLLHNRANYYFGSQLQSLAADTRETCSKRFDALSKLLTPDIFSLVVSRARFVLRDTEGIILGQTLDYVADANIENYEETLQEEWDASESKREGWQEHTDETSALGSVGQQVRKFLSTIPLMKYDTTGSLENGDVKLTAVEDTDDLGCTRYIDPASAHSQLIELLRGVQDEDEVVSMLMNDNGEPKELWLAPVVKALQENPQLRTQFFVDFKKNFQPYSIFQEDKTRSKKAGSKFYITKVINRIQGFLNSSYTFRITSGKKINNSSIFNDGSVGKPGTVNWQNMAALRDKVHTWVYESDSTNLFKPNTSKLLTKSKNAEDKSEKVRFLMEVFAAMGIEATLPAVEKIVSSNDIYKVHKILSDYFDIQGATGISLVLSNDNATAWANKEYDKMSDMPFKTLYNSKQKTADGKAKLREHTEKLLDIVSRQQEGLRLENRCRHGDKTLFSEVAPSYLGDKLERIKSYVRTNNKKGLRDYLLAEYCDNSFFAERDANGNVTHVYSFWVQALLDCCDTPEKIQLQDTFAGQFDFERDLGNVDQPFEDFTSQTHCIDMLIRYHADAVQNKSFKTAKEWTDSRGIKHTNNVRTASALYPVFVLGDSGVSKYVRAPRIQEDNGKWGEKSKEKIVDLLYEVFKQEERRKILVQRMNDKLALDGHKPVQSSDKYSVLVFLNEKEYQLPTNYQESDVKAVIRRYMDNATKEFIQKASNLGVLDEQLTKDDKPTGKLKHLNQLGTPQTINSAIEDFFWNTKLATINQLQMMTIDPSFYQNTKDLQKRYKEIHAPGSKLSLKARNIYKEGNPYFNCDENGVPQPERCVYFDDIEVNAENENAAFMRAIAYNEGIKIVGENASVEDIINAGKKTWVYKKYKSCSLTDGQGYRTLESYRKVLGMAGKWTQEMENVYDEIMTLREKYGKRVPKEGDADFKDYMSRLASISSKAVVFQPIKPYMFTHEIFTINSGDANTAPDKMLIPVQHKYAEAVLIPELLPEDSRLRDMAYWMDEHVETDPTTGKSKKSPIDLVCASTVVKVGGFGAAKIHDATTSEEFTAALEGGYVHQLDYEDYRIQTNVPEHINGSQLFGTQVRKLIMSRLNLTGTKTYNYLKNLRKSPQTVNLGGKWKKVNAQELNGRNLLALYNSLIVSNIVDSYEEFEREIGNIDNLADKLLQSVLSNSRESMDNLLSYSVTGDAKFLMPIFEGALEHDSAALLLSIFKKKVNKQAIKGGSAVQVSAFGITAKKTSGDLEYVLDPNNKNNILYCECEIPFNLNYYDVASKRTVSLDYDDYCEQNGELKVGKFLEEDDPEYNRYLSYVKDGKVYKPKIEIDYPDILSLIAYRIPTERAYSMINLKVKRFSRPTAGGTIKVPSEGTTIAGFDFDIDKLYFMRREYRKHTINSQYDEAYFNKEDRAYIFERIYTEHPEIQKALNLERSKHPFSNAPLHSYWKDARIEERFGYSKNELFEYIAKEDDIEPETVVSDDAQEYFEDYDFDKTPEQNSRAARNNLLIDLMQARLSDPETFSERYTPGGFENARKAARKIRELIFGKLDGLKGSGVMAELERRYNDKSVEDPEPNYDPTDPMTIINYNQQNQVAGKLIGIFANQNTNHAFASSMSKFVVKPNSLIEFAGHTFKEEGVGGDFLNAPHRKDGQNDVDLYIAELLAASVDAVKDPVLNFLNLNIYTADTGATLMRLGYTAEEVGLLFNQPVIKQLCDRCANENSNINKEIDALVNHLEGIVGPNKVSVDLSTEFLANTIIENREALANGDTGYVDKHAAEQLAVLKMFEKALKVANDVSLFITNTKFTASNAVGSTFGEMYAQQLRVNDYVAKFVQDKNNRDKKNVKDVLSIDMEVVQGNPTLDSIEDPISDREDLLSMSKEEYMDKLRMNPFAYEQAMYDMNRKAINLLAPKDKKKKAYYPYGRQMYVNARAALRDLSDYNLDGETIDATHRDLLVYLMANQENSVFCGEQKYIKNGEKTKMSNRQYYETQFVQDLYSFLEIHPELLELPIFKYLRPEEITDEEGKTIGYNIKVQDIGGIDPTTKELIKESWAALVATDENGRFLNPEFAQIAKDLFIWNFYKLGFDFSPLSFMNLAPTAVKEVIEVRRSHSIPVNKYTKCTPGTNDVYVFYPGNAENAQTAWEDYGFENGVDEGFIGDAYSLPLRDSSGKLQADAFKALCITAKSNSDRIFKIQENLTQEDLDEMTDAKVDIPSNIQFSEENVQQLDWSHVNYGVNRSYQEFLNEILDGTNESADIRDFSKQFLLNHLDNWRFVLNTSVEHLSKFIHDKVKPTSYGQYKERIVIDLNGAANNSFGEDDKVSKAFVKVAWGPEGIVAAKWKPLLKIGDAYYIADGEYGFNINKSLRMEYKLVKPQGSKGKSLMYKSGIEEAPVENRDTTQPTTNTPTPEAPKTDELDRFANLTIEQLHKIIDYNMLESMKDLRDDKGVYTTEQKLETIENYKQAEGFYSMSKKELINYINEVRNQARAKGVIFLDENGNPEQSC